MVKTLTSNQTKWVQFPTQCVSCLKERNIMEQEKKVLEKLAEAWHEFLKLEKQHPDEISDFCDGIHKCQLVIGMRFARESNPEIFPKKI